MEGSHEVLVVEDVGERRAKCSCGWTSIVHRTEGVAAFVAMRHGDERIASESTRRQLRRHAAGHPVCVRDRDKSSCSKED